MGKDEPLLAEIEAARRQLDSLRDKTHANARELVRRVRSGIDTAQAAIVRLNYVIEAPTRARAFARRHPLGVAAAALGLVTLGGAGIARWARQRTLAARPLAWSQRPAALAALLAHPDRAFAPRRSPAGGAFLGALVIAAISALAVGLVRGARSDGKAR